MAKVTIIAEGWIQSAGYRAFVKRAASQLGIKGLVRNLFDGKVEVFCDGNFSKISILLQKMDYKGKKDDALGIYVEKLSVYREGEKGYLGPWKRYRDFQIDYGFEIKSPVDRALLENLENRIIYVASFQDEFGLLKEEFSMFRKETNHNFETMEEKYGSISEEMKKINTTLEKLADAYVKRQK